jgi:molybdopterin converting factor small subunit
LIVKATVLLFAMAREKAGASILTVELPPNPTVRDLKAALSLACPALSEILPTLRIAIDSEYAMDEDQVIPKDTELAAIPPVSGGSSSEVMTLP